MIKRFLLLVASLFFFSTSATAGITDLKLSTAQIFDVQWYVSGGTLYASGFNYIYASVNYSTQTTSAARWTAAQTAEAGSNGRYIGFFNSTTNPGTYGMAVFNSDGSVFKIINHTGSFRALANGAIFYNGNGMWGTLITTGQGYSNGQSGNWAVTQDYPTSSQLQSYTPPSSTPLAAGQTAAPPAPAGPVMKPIYVGSANLSVAGITPTSYNSPGNEGAANAFDNNPSTKYLNFDKNNAGVTIKLNQGRVVSGFKLTTANDFPGRDPTSYKLYGSNDGVNWVLIKADTLTLTDNRFTQSSLIDTGNTNPYFYYFIYFPTTKAGQGCGLNCDSMQIGDITYFYDENNLTSSTDQSGGSGSISNPGTAGAAVTGDNSLCCGGSAAAFNAGQPNVNAVNAFMNRTIKASIVYIDQVGSNNSITVTQSGTRNNYAEYTGNGSSNSVTINQSGNASTTANYIDLGITGNGNTVSLTQQSTGGGKGIFAAVNNNSNSITVQQKDSGSHYLELSVSGGNKTVNVLQQGSASHMANINLGGLTTNLSLTQGGSTQQYYSITHSCATTGGCGTITVTQGQ
jgi:hypothetical protein